MDTTTKLIPGYTPWASPALKSPAGRISEVGLLKDDVLQVNSSEEHKDNMLLRPKLLDSVKEEQIGNGEIILPPQDGQPQSYPPSPGESVTEDERQPTPPLRVDMLTYPSEPPSCYQNEAKGQKNKAVSAESKIIQRNKGDEHEDEEVDESANVSNSSLADADDVSRETSENNYLKEYV